MQTFIYFAVFNFNSYYLLLIIILTWIISSLCFPRQLNVDPSLKILCFFLCSMRSNVTYLTLRLRFMNPGFFLLHYYCTNSFFPWHGSVVLSVNPPLWSKLKCKNNYRMDCHEILQTVMLPRGLIWLCSPDLPSSTISRSVDCRPLVLLQHFWSNSWYHIFFWFVITIIELNVQSCFLFHNCFQ